MSTPTPLAGQESRAAIDGGSNLTPDKEQPPATTTDAGTPPPKLAQSSKETTTLDTE